MTISAKINSVSANSNYRGTATLTIQQDIKGSTEPFMFVVTGYKILSGQNGLYVKSPSQSKPNVNVVTGTKDYVDIAYPVNKTTRDKISTLILNAYENYIESEKLQKMTFDDEVTEEQEHGDAEM